MFRSFFRETLLWFSKEKKKKKSPLKKRELVQNQTTKILLNETLEDQKFEGAK